ncbi:hypothetical protein ACH4F6_00450 [Streptomyces sp. NPDC017936]|uniref:hypothetical protein n=1 Tax=Streptomyces sp. NPDC017936 TaxID=3365016 RepID=UPI0037BD413F
MRVPATAAEIAATFVQKYSRKLPVKFQERSEARSPRPKPSFSLRVSGRRLRDAVGSAMAPGGCVRTHQLRQ